jgi:hypothetical protein
MRISVSASGRAFDPLSDKEYEEIVDPDVLCLLDGAQDDGSGCSDYLDADLADLGLVGGISRFAYSPETGLRVIMDFWAPERLDDAQLDALSVYAIGQWSDGVGENGFEIEAGGTPVLVWAETGPGVIVGQDDDARPVPRASRVAIAARDGDFESLIQALEAREDVDGTLHGMTALGLAITSGHAEAAMVLIKHGADVNRADLIGDRPLHLCALSNGLSDGQSAKIAAALLARGADKNAVDDAGDTPLTYALDREKERLQRVLST